MHGFVFSALVAPFTNHVKALAFSFATPLRPQEHRRDRRPTENACRAHHTQAGPVTSWWLHRVRKQLLVALLLLMMMVTMMPIGCPARGSCLGLSCVLKSRAICSTSRHCSMLDAESKTVDPDCTTVAEAKSSSKWAACIDGAIAAYNDEDSASRAQVGQPPAPYSRKKQMRILIRAIKWPFDSSGFRHGTKCCMGAPRVNGFKFAPLGALRIVAGTVSGGWPVGAAR